MDEDALFLWDLCGYLVVPSVLTPAEVAAANAAVDANVARALAAGAARESDALDARHGVARQQHHRTDIRGMLGWAEREPFQRMLAHPTLVPYLNALCGRGFRMDHPPTLVTQEHGSPDGILHDMQAGTGGFHPGVYYHWQDGECSTFVVLRPGCAADTYRSCRQGARTPA